MSRSIIVFLVLSVIAISFVFAQENANDSVTTRDGLTPIGATTAQDLYSPALAGGGGFTTSTGSAAASALNPAAQGGAQQIIINVGYLGLPNFQGEKGFGLGAASMGAVFPTKYAVFGGSVFYLQSPYDESFPVRSTIQGNITMAKELYPGMSVGAGFNAGFNTGNNWTLSGDVGFRYNMGNFGPLENFTWAFVARSMGKSWIPPMLSPAGGIAFDLLSVKGKDGNPNPLVISGAMDLIVPTGQNLAGKFGASALIAETIRISTSTQFNLRESVEGHAPSLIPSVGLQAIIKLKSSGNTVGSMAQDGELAIDMAGKPLYDGIWGIGGGLTWTLGVVDKNAPIIVIDYPEPAWISPNNDGKADYLEFPISITDERYVVEWTMDITDANGKTVRVYRNKETRPETQGVRNFVDRLSMVKGGVEVPPIMRWDGIFDSGEVAPDGKYYFTITAKDDNGNTRKNGPHLVNVRCTPPEIIITPFAEDMNIFAPGGGGSKNTLAITQRGSREDLWEAGIYNASGAMVKNLNLVDKAPAPFVWDGTDDRNSIVPDGVYNYRISSTDKAMNTGEASLENIIVNTIRPVVGLTISDAYFSPNGDGIKDTMVFSLVVPVREGISNWEVQIKDSAGTVQRTISGTTTIPATLEFDGRDRSGRILPEASYTGSLSVHYRNGYNSVADSPLFTLDITPPRAVVRVDDRDQGPGRPAVFSPIGIKNKLSIIQEGSRELVWNGIIRRQGERAAIRTFRFSGIPPARIEWDGITDSGALAPDGRYTYELFTIDEAGNAGGSNMVEMDIDTRDTPVAISTNYRAFSPNGDGVKDTINLIPQIQEKDGILSWKIDVFGSGGSAPVRSFEGRDQVPAQVVWNGRTTAGQAAPDGTYTAKLDLEYRSGNRPSSVSMPFIIDTIPPQGDASVPYTIFAPNGNGNRDTLPIRVTTEGNDEWNAVITNSSNQAVRTWNWTGRPDATPLIWNGKDQAGNTVADGTYSFTLSSTDEAGNSTRKAINNIMVDASIPKIFLTASAQYVAPKPNQAEAMRFNIIATPQSGVESWKMELRDENNTTVKTFPSPSGGSGTLPSVIPWNGASDRGDIREGRLTPELTVYYTKGDRVNVSAPPVMVDISGPILGFHSEPEYFSPDNDGVDDELFIYLSARDASPIANWSLEIRETEGTGQLFYRIEGRGSPSERIIWDGRSNRGELVQSAMDYEYTYSASDILGNSSFIKGMISTDVLVIRDGDILRIQIPSITFRANHADFVGIPQDRLDNNIRVLKRIAEILNRFRDYKITVEGHANPVLGTAREETEALLPLSLARAQFTIEQLASYGVNRSRLSPVGRGGGTNVANPQDQANNWKNRRVEFLLIK